MSDPYEDEGRLGATRRFMRGVMRSGMFTPFLLIALLVALSVAYVEHLHGNLCFDAKPSDQASTYFFCKTCSVSVTGNFLFKAMVVQLLFLKT